VPVDRLEKQMGELADRVDRLAGSPAPQAESARVGALLAEARAQIERSTPTAALAAIERRLEDLAKRMDQALQRPPAPAPIDPRAFDDLARRIDGVRASVERQTDPGKLEQALRALGDRPIEIDTAPIEAMMRELGAKMTAPTLDMRPFEGMLREISQKLDGRAPSAPAGELAATIRELGQRIDQRIGAPLDTSSLEEALRALHDRLDSTAPARLDVRFVEEAADLLAERLERRSGPSVDADTLAGQIAQIHDRLDALQTGGSVNAGLEQRVEDLIGELDATRQALQTPMAPAADQFADGLAELRADQDEADKRTQSRLGNVQDILERMVGRLGRLEDEIARVEDTHVAEPRAAAFASAPSLALSAEPFRAVGGAALRDVPERSPAPAQRAIDGADFLLEPGATRGRPRIAESVDSAQPKSAINAHIAAARRAAQTAMGESPAATPLQAAVQGRSSLAAFGGEAVAFAAQRRRPLLLAAAVIAAVAMLAVIELRGGRVPLLQKSELDAAAAKVAALVSPAPARTLTPALMVSAAPTLSAAPTIGAANLDTSPTGAITTPKAPPAELLAAIPTGLSQSLHDSAASGDVGAEFELALRLLDGRGMARDPHAAAQWFEQAANRGLPIAEYRLAALYEKGVGVTRDLPTAMSLYVKAATAGNARAMHNLAVMHAEGSIGGKPDYATAAEWFRKAGGFGIRDSQFNLGILYARGLGGPQDLGQAWLWFSLAAQQGDADSARKRDDIAAKMDPATLKAAAAALSAFKLATPLAAANEAPIPAGGWDGKSGSQASGPTKPATAL
jgi:localization factor PodJL